MELMQMNLGGLPDDDSAKLNNSEGIGVSQSPLGRLISGESPEVEERFPTDEEVLEIYQKAERFKALKLLSGNQIPGGVTPEYISSHYGKRGLQRYKLAKFVLSSLDYITNPDVLLTLSCTNKARVVIATAGAGKTTSLQFDLLISKMLDKALGENLLEPETVEGTDVELPRVLYLNYNKHNVQMIIDRHTAVCKAVNKLLRPSDAIRDDIESTTVHAFCHRWLKAFSSTISLPDIAIVSDDMKKKLWESLIKPRWTKFYDGSPDDAVSYEVLDELYVYKTESMLDWEEFFVTAKFVDSGLKPEFVKSCISKYDAMKTAMKQMNFTDYLLMVIKVLKENPEIKAMLQKRYRIIIADENQDFTRLMNELLLQLYNPEYNQLVVVGDPDQTIYDFKGVSPDNVVGLSEALEDCQLLGLDTNYRCPDKIVDAAKVILDRNILRFEKPINTVRTGGSIVAHPIQLGESQTGQVLSFVKRIGSANWPGTVITYRNNRSSVEVAEELYYSGIPFKILDARRPFNNPVFKQITKALKALETQDDFQLNSTLYRFLPISNEVWTGILNENRMQRRGNLFDIRLPGSVPRGTVEAFQALLRIAERMAKYPVCDYIDTLVKLYRTYYFNFLIRQTSFALPDGENYAFYLERTVKFYSRQMTFDFMMDELRDRNRDNETGVTLSTFHGLKGLEFNYVIAVDFDETIFPNYYGIEQRYSKNTAMLEKESANRLCYVLVTRTIKELHLFYTSTDPSIYVRLLTQGANDGSDESKKEELTLGMVGAPQIEGSKLDFMKRILGDRG